MKRSEADTDPLSELLVASNFWIIRIWSLIEKLPHFSTFFDAYNSGQQSH